MAREIIVPIQMPGGAESVKTIAQMEQELQEMNAELKELDVNSQAFSDLSRKIGTAQNELKGFTNELERMDPKKKAEQYVKMGEGIAGGFAIASGALAAFGADSEKLAQIEAKAQGAVAIATGIRAIREGELIEMLQKSRAAKLAAAAAEKVLEFATGGSTKAIKAFRMALVATGIGALVVGIGLLVANFDKLKNMLGLGVNPTTEEFAKVTIAAAEASKKAVDAFALEERRLRALGTAEKDITEERKKRLRQATKDLDDAVKAQQKLLLETRRTGDKEEVDEAQAKYDELINQRKEYRVQLLEIDKAARDREQEMIEQAEADYAKQREEREKKAEDERQKRIEKVKQEQAEMARVREEFDNVVARQGLDKYAVERLEIEKTAQAYLNGGVSQVEVEQWKQKELDRINAEIEAERVKSYEDGQAKLLELAQQNMLRAVDDMRERALLELQYEKEAQLEQLKQYENFLELKEALEVQYRDREDAINAEYDQKAIDANKAMNDAMNEQDKAARQAKIDGATSIVDSLMSINNGFTASSRKAAQKQFEVDKALQIAATAINTYKGALAAYVGMVASIPGPVGIGMGIAAGAAVTAAGLMNINKIRQTKFDGGGSVSASTPSGSAPSSSGGGGPQNSLPGVNLDFLGKGDVTNMKGEQVDQNGTNSENIPRAYVVSDDITTQQGKDAELRRLTRL